MCVGTEKSLHCVLGLWLGSIHSHLMIFVSANVQQFDHQDSDFKLVDYGGGGGGNQI